PYTPGSDTAGVVETVGNGVTSVKPGDRVYVGGTASGAYAELSLCGEAQVHPLPARVSYAQGAAMNVPYAPAYHALFQRGHGLAGTARGHPRRARRGPRQRHAASGHRPGDPAGPGAARSRSGDGRGSSRQDRSGTVGGNLLDLEAP